MARFCWTYHPRAGPAELSTAHEALGGALRPDGESGGGGSQGQETLREPPGQIFLGAEKEEANK